MNSKEGSKNGISLMMVSRIPSEVFDTIFAQCNKFISWRWINTIDKDY